MNYKGHYIIIIIINIIIIIIIIIIQNFSALGEPMDHDLLRIEGDHWKYVRSVLTPTFSSGKLREVTVRPWS